MTEERYNLFSVLMRLEGSIQLYNSALQVQKGSNKKYKDYYNRKMNYHKEMIEVFSRVIKIEGTPEDIASKEIPIVMPLLDYPPYLEYLKKYKTEKTHDPGKKEDYSFYT